MTFIPECVIKYYRYLDFMSGYSSHTISAYKKDIEVFVDFLKESSIEKLELIGEKKHPQIFITLRKVQLFENFDLTKIKFAEKFFRFSSAE